jgi:D-3-phosphoglycerate dehydrogenase
MPETQVVLLTNPMHADGEAILAPHVRLIVAPDARPETLRKWAAEANGIIVRAKLPDDIIDHAPRLKGMVRHGVGLDFIPVAAATARGVAVANLPGSNTNAVAEYVMSALMHLRRPLDRVDALMRGEGWATARAAADSLTECIDARRPRRRHDRAAHRRHRARRFRHDCPWHLPPQGIAARRRPGSHA